MGSGSALIAAGTYTDPRDGIVALGYIHGTLVDPRFIENVRVPTLIGSGTADTLNSGDTYFQSFNTTYNRNPIMTVMLTGTPHVSGTRTRGVSRSRCAQHEIVHVAMFAAAAARAQQTSLLTD